MNQRTWASICKLFDPRLQCTDTFCVEVVPTYVPNVF